MGGRGPWSIRGILKSIVSVLQEVWGFLFLLVRMPIERAGSDPAKATARQAARQVRRASHVYSGSTYFTGTSATDEVLGKELAAGHKTTVYGDPTSERPVMSYGGRTPKHRRKLSLIVTWLLVLLALLVSGLLPFLDFSRLWSWI